MSDKRFLVDKMRDLAKIRKDLPDNWLETAEELDKATMEFNDNPQMDKAKKVLGCWARARLLWCNATGDTLA
jgi:hypothetical protein